MEWLALVIVGAFEAVSGASVAMAVSPLIKVRYILQSFACHLH